MRLMRSAGPPNLYVSNQSAPVQVATAKQTPAQIVRSVDETFSEPVFLEWATLLYVRANEARDEAIDSIRPYFSVNGLQNLMARDAGASIADVRGVIVGSISLNSAQVSQPSVLLTVAFHSNRTEVDKAGREQAFYFHERWVFSRARGVKSRVPEAVEKMGCPSCGSPVERTSLDRCVHCGESYRPGATDWSVVSITIQEREKRPPLLTGEVEEVGTNLATVRSSEFQAALDALRAGDSTFTLEGFVARVKEIFFTLQEGWSKQQWAMLRPNETDALFQSHRFWLEEYQRQKLRNVLERIAITRLEPVKIDSDAHYDAITCRIYASMRDSTVRATGEVVGGNAKADRVFTEYWTLIRRRGVKTAAKATAAASCPNCGAPLRITQAGVCESCDAKIVRGDFGWVLSRIEQDEEYKG